MWRVDWKQVGKEKKTEVGGTGGEQSHKKDAIWEPKIWKVILQPRKWKLHEVQKVVQKKRIKLWLLFKSSPIIGIFLAPFQTGSNSFLVLQV